MLRTSEAIVLRTYPVHESDLLITLFTRAEGKIRGVAKAAMKSRRRFGGALEPMTVVRAHYDQRERRELARMDAFEIIASPLTDIVGYERICALSFLAEVLDQLLADHDPHDDVFRLANSVLRQLRSGPVWMPLTYFSVWMTRLVGFLPDIDECVACGTSFGDSPAYFHALVDGVLCSRHKRLASSELPASSRALAAHIFRHPVEHFVETPWPKSCGADLRKMTVQIIERHIDRKLSTASILNKLD